MPYEIKPLGLAPYFEAYLSPNMVQIDNVRDHHSYTGLQSLSHLVSCIAQKCPHICSLKLTNAAINVHPQIEPIYVRELANSLGQLFNLRVLGLGPIALDPEVLRVLGALPALESIIVNETPNERYSMKAPGYASVSLPSDSFSSLQHLGIRTSRHGMTEPATQIWSITALVSRITLTSARIISTTTENEILEFVRAMCQSSPFITGLYLDAVELWGLNHVALLAPEMINILARLPLQRLWLSQRDVDFGKAHWGCELFAAAFSEMEYLRIRGYCFTFKDLSLIAKYMHRLQELSVRVKLDTYWSSRTELSSFEFTSSPSRICLNIRLFRATVAQPGSTEVRYELPQEKVETVAGCLHALWPDGVVCGTDQRPAKGGNTSWTYEVNAALRRLQGVAGHSDQTLVVPRRRLRRRVPPWMEWF